MSAWPVERRTRPGFDSRSRPATALPARALLQTAHGPVETPAFIPLATKGSVRGLSSAEVAGLGYELVLGNTFHLLLVAGRGADRRSSAACTGFMGWERAIITDSGGFQVFSLAHGGVADEIKGRRGSAGGEAARASRSPRRGSRFRSYLDGSERFLGPEDSMAVQAALGSDIALVFDECTPFHADRDYTARSTERTHRWLDRCLDWHERDGPGRAGGLRDRPGRRPRGPAPRVGRGGRRRPASTGSRSAAPSAATRRRCTACSAITAPLLPDEAPQHLLGIGEVDDLLDGIGLGIDLFDCASRPGSPATAMALAPEPERPLPHRPDARRRYAEDDSARSSRAAPARPAAATPAPTSTTWLATEELTGVRAAHPPQPDLHASARRRRAPAIAAAPIGAMRAVLAERALDAIAA